MSKAHDEQRATDVKILHDLAEKQGGQSRRNSFHAAADALESTALKQPKSVEPAKEEVGEHVPG